MTALNPQAAPEDLRDRLANGVEARVPGEATMDLLRAGLIGDPYDGDNEQAQQWIGDVDWRFTCRFDWHDDGSQRHDLVAYGLDTVAALELNGRPVGSTQNAYRSYRWDVRDLLKEGGNTLVVSFTSPVREGERRQAILGYYPHDNHPFNQLRKAASSFGWDWGIDVANAGIWQPIGIDSWSGVRIAQVRPLVDVDDQGEGLLTVDVDLERAGGRGRSGIDETARPGTQSGGMPVRVHLGGNGADVRACSYLKAGADTVRLVLRVPDVQLWWPLGYGDHTLYTVDVTAGQEEAAAGSNESRPQAMWTGRVGFRTVSVDTAADENGRPFRISVNGVPVHAHGYNWIPDDAFITRMNRDRYQRRMEDLVESNSNMVRIWGGGYYESDDFYDMADENGVMVWQDFMFACAAYPEDPDNWSEVEAEAREQIGRLSPHPSLVVWNGSNENYTAYADWGGFKNALADPSAAPNAYGYGERPWGDGYYSDLFPRLFAQLDPTRIYLPSSPMSFTKYTSPNKDNDGTVHIWDVWNNKDYRAYRDYKPRFADEFGYQAPPAWSTLTRVVHDSPLDPFGTQMLVHQKAIDGNIKLSRGMRSHLTPGDFYDISYGGVVNGQRSDGPHSWLIPSDRWEDIEDWHWACQLQQAQAIRFGVEYMRSLEPVNAGTLVWQLNDDWPVISWAAVDYDGHRKPLWFASRDFFAPRLASIQPEVSEEYRAEHSWAGMPVAPDQLALVMVNDTRQAWEGQWRVERRRLDGTVLADQIARVSIPAGGQAQVVLEAAVTTFGDPAQEILVANSDQPGFARVIYNPAEVVDQALRPDPFEASIEAEDRGYRLTLTARTYARDVFCMVDKVDPAASIDGGMATLLPGESVVWHITSAPVDNPEAFLSPKVLRTANDLHRQKL